MKTIIRKEVLQSDLTAIADDKGKKFTYRELRERAQGLENFMEERWSSFYAPISLRQSDLSIRF